MSLLKERIAAIIRREGPMDLDRYWNLALFDREHGYYATRDPFGASGDFVTAPEVSQMFGELIGVWMLAAWRALGHPSPFVLAEIGPGRGTLMADMLRTLGKLDQGCLKAARVALVETSDRLALEQARRLASFDVPIRHHRRLRDAEPVPLFVVANEVFDAVAIRQSAMTTQGWRRRCVGLDVAGRLAFELAAAEPAGDESDQGQMTRAGTVPIGAILETSPERAALADEIATQVARCGGAAVIIDYGHAASGFGDTFQAVRNHGFADPLEAPGEADLTSHVDFSVLGSRFKAAGLAVAPVTTQGEFLNRLGLRERAEALSRGRAPKQQEIVAAAASRLSGTGATEMGTLFKVLAGASSALPLTPFDEPGVD